MYQIQAISFLNPDQNTVHNPFLLNDVDIAVKRIAKAIENNEKIFIYGDYDVDGITSVSVLYLYLKNFLDNISYFIPDRFSEGYGLNKEALDNLLNDGCSLIITVDTGISAIEEIDYANSLGIDVIITDHHECKAELPDFEDAYIQYEGKVTFLMVNVTDNQRETVEVAKSYVSSQGYTFPVYFDTGYEASYKFGISSIPQTFFLNADGQVVAKATGLISASQLEEGIGMIYSE